MVCIIIITSHLAMTTESGRVRNFALFVKTNRRVKILITKVQQPRNLKLFKI